MSARSHVKHVLVEQTSGELDAFYVRYERCAVSSSSGMNDAAGKLFGHGLSSGEVKLPNTVTSLRKGRYYISVRGWAEMCGEYNITVANQTYAEFIK